MLSQCGVLFLKYGRRKPTELGRSESMPSVAIGGIDKIRLPSPGVNHLVLWKGDWEMGAIQYFYGSYFYSGLWFAEASFLPTYKSSQVLNFECVDFDPSLSCVKKHSNQDQAIKRIGV